VIGRAPQPGPEVHDAPGLSGAARLALEDDTQDGLIKLQ